jgi:SMC interacting uncharacterized protein involved in chromosome segregation
MIDNSRIVFSLTEEMHQDLANIYEAVVDEDKKVPEMIDNLRRKLKELKDNTIKLNVV